MNNTTTTSTHGSSRDKVILCLFTILISAMAAPVHAMTCGQFTALGGPAKTVEQVVNAPATEPQVEEYKKVIASHAGDLAFVGISARAKALQVARKNGQLTMLVRESLAMTRAFCFDRKNDPMKDVAIEQFDYLLDAIAKRLNL